MGIAEYGDARGLPILYCHCAIVAGAGPAGPLVSALAQTLPRVAIPLIRPFIRGTRGATWWLRRVRWLARRRDRHALERPDVEPTVVASIVEAVRQGSKGVAHETTLLGQPWGFSFADIAMPIQLWHGEDDFIVPAYVGRAAARGLRDVTAVFVPREAHKSILVNHGDEILSALAAGAER